MSNDFWKNVSDEELKVQYSKCCDDLDVVEDHIRDITMEMDRRKVEKEGKEAVPRKELEELIKKWSVDSMRKDQEVYQKCITDLSDIIHST